MVYLIILYKENGKVEIREFLTRNALRIWIVQKEGEYIAYDIYMAKCVNYKLIDIFPKR